MFRDALELFVIALTVAILSIPATAARGAEEPAKDATATKSSTPAQRRPNLVFVFSDQQSSDMLGCYGNKQIITPHLDAFATEGVRFNHCVSSQPVCTPYRGMLLTGQHPLRCGAIKNDVRIVPGEGHYFGEVLRDAGYRLGYFGKWHIYGGDRNRPIPPGPFRYGFDHDFLSNNCTLLYDPQHAYYWDDHGQKQLYGDWEPYGQTRQAMRFIEENAAKPFALVLSWHPPHNWPSGHGGYEAPKDLLKLYDPSKLTLRTNVKDTPRHRQMYQGHMAMCTGLDRAFGDLMERLKTLGLAENTIVVYTSDHGDTLMSHAWPGNKGVPEVESCRVPLLIRCPGRLAPRSSNLLFGTLDFMPTLLGLMGLTVPETCQGRNLADAIRSGDDDAVKSVPLFYFAGNWRGVYTREHTFAFDLPGGEVDDYAKAIGWKHYACLYDHAADPRELRNLFDAPEHHALREKLHAQTLAWMKQFGDTGMPFKDLLKRVMVTEDIGPDPGRGDGPFGQGRLKGRPLDVLSGLDHAWRSEPPADCPFEPTKSIAPFVFTGRHAEYTKADTWYPSWAADGNLYSPWTDGEVNRLVSNSAGKNATTGYAKILGDDPLSLKVVEQAVYKSDPSPYGSRYPSGSLVHNGVWYYGTYCLGGGQVTQKNGITYNWPWMGPFVGFRWSTDLGKTWTQTPCTPAKPLFGEQGLKGEPVKIGAPHFVDFGKNMEHSPDGKAYLVAHGTSDGNNRRFGYDSWITGDEIYLMRVTPSIENMNDASKYEFFDGRGWTKDFSMIKPIAAWRDHMGCVTMTYNAPLKKFLMCVTDGVTTGAAMHTYILESDQITGPWKLVTFLRKFGEQGYFANFPSKFISADGRTLWLSYSANFFKFPSNPPGSRYSMCLQEIKLPCPGIPKRDAGN